MWFATFFLIVAVIFGGTAMAVAQLLGRHRQEIVGKETGWFLLLVGYVVVGASALVAGCCLIIAIRAFT